MFQTPAINLQLARESDARRTGALVARATCPVETESLLDAIVRRLRAATTVRPLKPLAGSPA